MLDQIDKGEGCKHLESERSLGFCLMCGKCVEDAGHTLADAIIARMELDEAKL